MTLVRPVPLRLSLWIAVSLPYFLLVLVVTRARTDLPSLLADPAYVSSAAALALTAIGAAGAALVLSVPGRERHKAQRALPLVAAIAWPAVLVGGGTGPAASTAPGLCAVLIVAIAAGPAWLLLRHVREGATCAPAWTGALIMLASGCGAALVLQLHCPAGALAHLLSEHVLAVAVLAGGGAAAAWLARPLARRG